MIYSCRWLMPIERPPVESGWIEIDRGLIRRVGRGRAPAAAQELGDVALLPGLVNAHTHLELSWMAGRVAPAESMVQWIRAMLQLRRTGAPDGAGSERNAAREAALTMRATGTVLVGDISNALWSAHVLADTHLDGVVFHELLGFGVVDPVPVVAEAIRRIAELEAAMAGASVRLSVAAHAPYSVSSALFREIAGRNPSGPLTVHLGESPEEIEFLRSGEGDFRRLLEELEAWTDDWQPPQTGPVDYLASLGYLRPGMLAVHGVHLTDDELDRLRQASATVVTCPRSNLWVGAGMPRVSHFYASGVPVAIGTDSLASVGSLNLFDELSELRRIAPDVTAASLLDSATRVGAEALGFGDSHGTIAPGKSGAVVAVEIPAGVTDVEEYLVSGVPASAVRCLP